MPEKSSSSLRPILWSIETARACKVGTAPKNLLLSEVFLTRTPELISLADSLPPTPAVQPQLCLILTHALRNIPDRYK